MNIKIIIRAYEKNKQGECLIKFRISHRSSNREISSEFHIEPKLFNEKTGKVRKTHPNADFLNFELEKRKMEYQKKVLLIDISEWSVTQLIEFLKGKKHTPKPPFLAPTSSSLLPPFHIHDHCYQPPI